MTGCCIIAAGNATRMAAPKMLLPYNGTTLLQHLITQTNHLKNQQTIVVTGFYHDAISNQLKSSQVKPVYNLAWQEGMGTSIRTGIQFLMKEFNQVQQVFILTCDQPFITTKLLQQMLEIKTNKACGIVACRYQNTVGVPALFDKKYFSMLLQLDGDRGAKKILNQFKNDLLLLDFPEGAFDIDTIADYEKLISKK